MGEIRKPSRKMRILGAGAGEGNRTLVISLEGFCSTIELHPPCLVTKKFFTRDCARLAGGGGWIRTNVGARPTDLQSAPFSRSGTPPAEPEIMSCFRQLRKIPASIDGLTRALGPDGAESAPNWCPNRPFDAPYRSPDGGIIIAPCASQSSRTIQTSWPCCSAGWCRTDTTCTAT